jgi:hypothetical protein
VRTAVEVARVLGGRGEQRVVDDHVALDDLQPRLPQVGDEAPPALDGHQRVAAPLQVQVPLQDAPRQRSLGKGARAPGIGRPEHVQGGVGRQQLHHRRRGSRHLGVHVDQAFAGDHVAHHDRDGLVRHQLLLDHGARLLGQPVGQRRAGQEGDEERRQEGDDEACHGERL